MTEATARYGELAAIIREMGGLRLEAWPTLERDVRHRRRQIRVLKDEMTKIHGVLSQLDTEQSEVEDFDELFDKERLKVDDLLPPVCETNEFLVQARFLLELLDDWIDCEPEQHQGEIEQTLLDLAEALTQATRNGNIAIFAQQEYKELQSEYRKLRG